MSFLQQKIIPRGYIAAPPKRLNSISEIGLKPALPNLPRPYVKRANIDPFEQHYVTPFIRMFDEEEAEKAKNKAKTDEQKAAAKYSIGNRIANATDNPLETLYNLVTLPTEITHALERKINTGNETARELKVIAAEDEDEENANYQDEKDKEIRQTVDEISTFVRRTGGLPKWGIRKLQAIKEKYFPTDVDVSSDLQAWNKEEEERRLQREAASQQMQGLITSKFQQKGYKERMDATKSVQSLLKAQEVQKEQERQQEATKALQGLLLGNKTQHEFKDENASAQQLQGLLETKKQQKEYEAVQKAAENIQGLFLARPKIVEKQREKRMSELEEERKEEERKEEERKEKIKAKIKKRHIDPRGDDDNDVIKVRPPVLKRSRFDGAFETIPSFKLDLEKIKQEVKEYLAEQPRRRVFLPPGRKRAALEIYLRNKSVPHLPFIQNVDRLGEWWNYQYNPVTKELVSTPHYVVTRQKGFKWV